MYATYKLFGGAKRWWQAKRDLLVMELGSEGALLSSGLRRSTMTAFSLKLYKKRRVGNS